MTPEQRHRAAKLIYERVQALMPPFDDLDTDRQTQTSHMGSGLRRAYYDIVDDVERILLSNMTEMTARVLLNADAQRPVAHPDGGLWPVCMCAGCQRRKYGELSPVEQR